MTTIGDVQGGDIGGPNEEERRADCGFCLVSIPVRVTALVAHALDECRLNLRAERDDLKKERGLAMTAMLEAWAALNMLDSSAPEPVKRAKEKLRAGLMVLGTEPM
jgi:hypothetical protein